MNRAMPKHSEIQSDQDTASRDPTTWSAALLREQCAVHLLATPVSPVHTPRAAFVRSDFDLNPTVEQRASNQLRAAAVLVAITARADGLHVLLTERPHHMTVHAGQIAFAGGKIDPDDAGPLQAALREANEELGIQPAQVEPLGYLGPYRTATGYDITPVVALLDADAQLKPDPGEVADHFEVPFGFLMNADNHRIETRLWKGGQRRFYAIGYENRYIWGATAGILKALHERLFAT